MLPRCTMRASTASGFSIDVHFDIPEGARSSARKPRARRRMRVWPLLMCAAVAALAGGAALVESPVGRTEAVRPYADAARNGVAAISGAVASGAHRVGLTR
jgi:hypothetical protein